MILVINIYSFDCSASVNISDKYHNKSTVSILIYVSAEFSIMSSCILKKMSYSCCAQTLLVCSQSGRVVTGSESRGGFYDYRYGCQPGCCGAALHLLHLSQKVRPLSLTGCLTNSKIKYLKTLISVTVEK